MAIVIPQVEPQAVEPPRIQEVANEETFGGGPGLAAEGQQTQEVAAHANEIATFEKIRADQTAVQAGAAQLADIQNRLITDPNNGLPAYQGVNAMEGHDKVIAEFQKQANAISKNLQPDQQGAFNREAVMLGRALDEHATAYVSKQLEQHDTNTFDAAFTNYMQAASLNYGSDKTVAQLKNSIDNMVGARAKRLGLDEDETKAFKFGLDTKFHESVLSQMVNDPAMMPKAKEYFEAHEDEMDADSRDRIRQLIDAVPKQREETAKQQQSDYYKAQMHQAMEDMFNGKMSLGEAQRRFTNGQLDQADYDILQSQLNKPDAQVMRTFMQSDPQTFNEIRNAQLTGSSDPAEIQRMIARGSADKKITADDGKYLLSMTSDKPPTTRDKYIDAQANAIRDFGNRYFAETNMFGMTTNKDKTSQSTENLVSNFYNSVDKSKAQTTKQIDDLRDHIIQQGAIQRYPGLGKLDKMPDVVIDVKGRVTRLLNPDQHSGLKPKYRIVPTAETESDKKE